jgi:ABC-2 type transport system ATP-binding protein
MIEAVGLTKDFKNFRAVEDITFKMDAGSVLAVLGPNGAGKTTTVRMLTSILEPTSGWAKVAGYDVVKQPAQVRASVGVLTEQHGLYERMKAMEYLDFFGQVYQQPAKVRHDRSKALLERFGLWEAANRRVGEYSKGMKQKLALVRAMLHNPPVLLLDEPTSAMDPQSAKQVRDALVELQADKRTIILTTHNLTEAQILADRIAVIRRGRIIAIGTFAELSKRFVGDPIMEVKFVETLNGIAKDLSSVVNITESGTDWLRYRTTEPEKTNPAILRWMVEHGAAVVTLSAVQNDLESVYLQIVEEDEKKGAASNGSN